jgi:hypothetical protein
VDNANKLSVKKIVTTCTEIKFPCGDTIIIGGAVTNDDNDDGPPGKPEDFVRVEYPDGEALYIPTNAIDVLCSTLKEYGGGGKKVPKKAPKRKV